MNRTEGTATRWDIVLMALGAGILAGFQVGKVPPALPFLREDLALSLVTAGWLTSIYYASGAVTGVAVGLLADRVGPRRLMIIGLLFLAGGSFLGGAVEDSVWLLTSRFIEGFGFVGITVTAPKLIAAATHAKDQGMAFGIWGAYMPIGMAIAMLISPSLIDAVGWNGFWFVSAAIVAVFIVSILWSLRPQRWPVTFQTQALDWTSIGTTFLRPALWLFGLCFVLYTLQWLAIMSFLPTFLIETQGRSAAGAALWGACVVGANAFGNFAAAWLMHKHVRRWVLIGVAYCAMGGASSGVFLTVTPADIKIFLAFVFSAVGGLLPAAVIAGGAAHAPSATLVAMASGFVVQGAALGSLVGPPVLATAVEGLGSWAATWWVMLAVAAVGLCLVAMLILSDRPQSVGRV